MSRPEGFGLSNGLPPDYNKVIIPGHLPPSIKLKGAQVCYCPVFSSRRPLTIKTRVSDYRNLPLRLYLKHNEWVCLHRLNQIRYHKEPTAFPVINFDYVLLVVFEVNRLMIFQSVFVISLSTSIWTPSAEWKKTLNDVSKGYDSCTAGGISATLSIQDEARTKEKVLSEIPSGGLQAIGKFLISLFH